MRGLVTWRAAMFAAALALVPSVAWAQGNNAALAEQRFSEGLAALKGERWAAACEAFTASNAADPSPGTLINLGVCSEKQKKFATAWTYYETAYRLATEKGRDDKQKVAKTEMDRLAPSVHRLHITMAKPVEGATVYRGGEYFFAIGGDDPAIDPGKQTFELRAKGKKSITKEITIPEAGGKTTLDFGAMEDAPVDQPGGGAGVGDGSIGGPVIVTNDGSGQRTVGIIVGGVGILALLTAGGVQILALNEDKKAEDFRKQAADSSTSAADRTELEKSAKSRQEAAENNQLIAIVAGAGGVVLLGVGIVLFVTAPSKKSASGKPQILPAVGPGYAGASFGFSF